MRIIEHRRHTMRVPGGVHLTQAGVDLARRVGAEMHAWDLVITSTVSRAYETAIAMGFAVDEERPELATLPEGFESAVRWDEGFGAIAAAARANPGGPVARLTSRMAELHRGIAARLPEEGRALLISHGGIVEASAVGCAPQVDFASWGPSCQYCEGVRLFYEGDRCHGAELLRVG